VETVNGPGTPGGRRLEAQVAFDRWQEDPDDGRRLAEALRLTLVLLPDTQDTDDGPFVHEVLGDLYFHRSVVAGADTTASVDAVRAAAAHHRSATETAGPDADLALLRQKLSLSLVLLGRRTDDPEALRQALAEFGRAVAEAEKAQHPKAQAQKAQAEEPQAPTGAESAAQDPAEPWWLWPTAVEMLFARGLLWGQWHDMTQLVPAEGELADVLSREGALDDLDPNYQDLLGRLLYAVAAESDDDASRELALDLLGRAVAGWRPDVDGSVLPAATALTVLQFSRYGVDHDPDRLADVDTGAGILLALPDLDPEMRTQFRMLRRAVHVERVELGLAEADPAITEGAGEDYAAILRGAMSEMPDLDESGRSAMEREMVGTRPLADAFDRLYDRWKSMEPGSEDHGAAAGGLLTQALNADPHGRHIGQERIEELLAAAVAVRTDDSAWQVGLRGLTSMLLARGGSASGGPAVQRAVEHAERAALLGAGDQRLQAVAGLSRSMAAMMRGQLLGSRDDVEAALAEWQAVRGSDALDDGQRQLYDAQFASFSVAQAVARRDLADVDTQVGTLARVFRGMPAEDMSRVETWTLLSNARMARDRLAEELGEPALPPDPGRPAAAEIRAAARKLPQDHRAWVLGDNGTSLCADGVRTRDLALLVEGVALVEEALELCDEGGDSWLRYAYSLGISHCARAQFEQRLSRLDAGIGWLERALSFTGGPEHRLWVSAGMSLGHAYRLRSQARGSTTARADRDRARAVGLDALRGHAWATFLQSGTEHATQSAAEATEVALDVAGWCLEDGATEEAVRALDSCRGLVLHAATTAMTVPDRLVAAGRADQADEWRAAGEDGANGGASAAASGAPGASSDLRRRVLETLTGPEGARQPQDMLLEPPGPGEIGAALRALGADALAYLVPGGEDRNGATVVITSDGRTHTLPLVHLRERSGPIRDYRPLPQGRDMGPANPVDGQGPPLRKQLDRLCAWAWSVAMKPLLDALGAPERTPVVILVPMGAFSVVPWHAAWEPGLRGTRTYAVERATISYAVSARLLCDVAARPAVRHRGTALIVGNPTGDLRFAGEEAAAVRQAFYPDGEFVGARATPDRVRDWLRGPDSAGGVLHLACHGTVEEHRRHSAYLALSGGELAAEELTEAARGPGAGVDVLERVVFVAFRRQVSGRGHNEAYSLATAFLVTGARSVVGSLWPVPDDTTSVLMFMVHHFLRREGEPPGRALRRAQLWMLDPARRIPDDMPQTLRERAAAVDPDDLSGWAGFTHLGQ
jgi:CHAT domain